MLRQGVPTWHNFLYMRTNQNAASESRKTLFFLKWGLRLCFHHILLLPTWNRDAMFGHNLAILWPWRARSHDRSWQITIKTFLDLFSSDSSLIIHLSSSTRWNQGSTSWFQLVCQTYSNSWQASTGWLRQLFTPSLIHTVGFSVVPLHRVAPQATPTGVAAHSAYLLMAVMLPAKPIVTCTWNWSDAI